jgi:alkaline phosphatase D
MKLAFTSGMLQQRFEQQPVWQRIQAQDPDYLLLLGNSIHLDVDAAVRGMSAGEFAAHAHGLYHAQLAVPEFDALLRHLTAKGGRRVFAVWDDEDFLWHGAAGADIVQGAEHLDKLEPSRVLFQCFQQALVDVGSFPARLDEITPPSPPETGPLHESLALQDDVWLHLSDGRSQRTGTWRVPHAQRALLGMPQLDAMATAIDASTPGSLHLLASGSTSCDWKHYPREWAALGRLAARRRLLMLSGGLQVNAFASYVDAPGWPLHEATASGAAMRDAVLYGAEVENFAMAEIGSDDVRIRFFDREGETASRRIQREDWHLAAGR